MLTGTCVVAGKTYARVLGDIQMALAHPPAVAAFLKTQMLAFDEVLVHVAPSKGHARCLGSHAEWENATWLLPVQMEVC